MLSGNEPSEGEYCAKLAEDAKINECGREKKSLRQSTLDETLFGRPSSSPKRSVGISVSKSVLKRPLDDSKPWKPQLYAPVVSACIGFSTDEVQQMREKIDENAKKKPFRLNTRLSLNGSSGNNANSKESSLLVQSLISYFTSENSDSETKQAVNNDGSDAKLYNTKIFSSTDGSHESMDIEFERKNNVESGSSVALKEIVSIDYLGSDADSLFRRPQCKDILPRLIASQCESVLIAVDTIDRSGIRPPMPFPKAQSASPANYGWDSAKHVRLPCSKQSKYPAQNSQIADVVLVDRWPLVQMALSQASNWKCSQDVENAIMSYNYRNKGKWSFETLHKFFETDFNQKTSGKYLLQVVLPKMAELALRLPDLITQPLPLLPQLTESGSRSVTLSQEQAVCLLANAFFCTFPCRNSSRSSLPEINFNGIFARSSDRGIEKLKCLLHYFHRVTSSMPNGLLTFERRSLQVFPDWVGSQKPLCRLHICASGTIEDDGRGFMQIDFANKYIGGGVLRSGCVQEEIRFLICPELIIGCLLTEVLSDTECLLMTGAERFSNYSGYAHSFEWAGDHVDDIARDEWCRKETEIVAIDALQCYDYSSQFKQEKIFRELNKAYVGFSRPMVSREHLSAIATGNWGCGAFGGDTQLKSILQLLAASESNRDLAYYTFRDRKLMQQLNSVHAKLCSSTYTVGALCKLVFRYGEILVHSGGYPDLSLFDYILHDEMETK